MKEQLEWLMDNMPDGCTLDEIKAPSYWQLYVGSLEYDVYPDQGDIGLAPVTALLKQELLKAQKGLICTASVVVSDDGLRQRWALDGGDLYGTEFEPHYYAYRKMKEAEE